VDGEDVVLEVDLLGGLVAAAAVGALEPLDAEVDALHMHLSIAFPPEIR
jgi:hypothetical protein